MHGKRMVNPQPQKPPLVVPVFPLPNVVLFPQTVVPLHVFEQRYRTMVRDVQAGDGWLALALLRPGYEREYEGSPAFYPVGTAGRIDDVRRLADGRFLLNVIGIHRVQLDELGSDRPYRLARITPRPEVAVDESDSQVLDAKRELLAGQAVLAREISGEGRASLVVDDRLPFAAAVNGACANLPLAPEVRQRLLQLDELREREQQAAHLIDRLLAQLLELQSPDGDEQNSSN